MARLKNLQHEAFCVLVELQGWTKTDAYEGAGFKRDRANASAFSERPEIASRSCRKRSGPSRRPRARKRCGASWSRGLHRAISGPPRRRRACWRTATGP
jgi:hypothetical protein